MSPTSKKSRLAAAACALFLMGLPALAGTNNHLHKGDNSAVNTRDRDSNLRTADRQGMNKSDREITRRIRRSLMEDNTLSTYAKNVKVITQKGHVTLRGPVRSVEERNTITNQAKDIAGTEMVKDELQIVSN